MGGSGTSGAPLPWDGSKHVSTCHARKQRAERPTAVTVGGVSIRSGNGAPSPKGCKVNK